VALGGFDEALGAGTLTRGGEDLDIFVRVLRSGRAVRYVPNAIVWHHHRSDDDALVRQMYGYGTGLSAYLSKLLMTPATRNDVLRRVLRGVLHLRAIKTKTDTRMAAVAPPPGARRKEYLGYLTGPLLYARARRAAPRPAVGAG
jgi:GT2 family glycosyltransferase